MFVYKLPFFLSVVIISNFSKESKRLKYSTKLSIVPTQWNFKTNLPRNKGKGLSPNRFDVKTKIDKFSSEFQTISSRCDAMGVEFTFDELKNHFDAVFGNVRKRNDFFGVYDLFVDALMVSHC